MSEHNLTQSLRYEAIKSLTGGENEKRNWNSRSNKWKYLFNEG